MTNRKNKIVKLKFRSKNAFSIGEVILSVFILGVTMLTILSLYSNGLRNFQDERDSIVASILAQEGVEIIRNIRDNNWAKRDSVTSTTPSAFSGFPVSSGSIQNDCRVDANSYSIDGDGQIIYPNIDCSGANRILYINPSGFYVHGAGTATKFRRTITLNNTDQDKMVVSSFVSWSGSNPPILPGNCNVASKCVFSQSTLTDWGTGL